MDPTFGTPVADGATTLVAPGGSVPRSRGSLAVARPFLVGELAVLVALLVFYDRVRSLAAVRSSLAINHGWDILHLETVLHLRVEDSLNSWLDGQSFLRLSAVDYYQFMHLTMALGVLTACYVLRPAVYRASRNALVLTNVIGLVVFAVFPVAPPRLLPGGGFFDSVAEAGFGTNHGPIPADQYGAMPSLHLAWATWAALTVFAMTPRLAPRLLLVTHVAVTAFVVQATGNHYLLDVVTGVLLGGIVVGVTGVLAPQGGRLFLPTLVPADLLDRATARVRPIVAPRSSSPTSRLAPESETPEP